MKKQARLKVNVVAKLDRLVNLSACSFSYLFEI